MARIALLDASDGTATAVRSVAGNHELTLSRQSAAASADLVIIELRSGEPLTAVALPGPTTPVLLLADRPDAVDTVAFGSRALRILKKPCDLLDLRRSIRDLLEQPAGAAALPPEAAAASLPWLSPPLVPASVAPVLAAARRLGGAVWIFGESGTGTDYVAAALALAWDPGREPIVWQETDPFSSAAEQLRDARRVLWVPALEDRPVREQHCFERYLAMERDRRVVVTSGDNPEETAQSGALLRSLYGTLSRVALRLPPLRERAGEIASLATSIGSRVVAEAFGASPLLLTADARRTLESYGWPGNLAELEAVVTRSAIAAGARGASAVELSASHLLFAPSHLSPTPVPEGEASPADTAQGQQASAGPRRAVVVLLGGNAGARAARDSSAGGQAGDKAPSERTFPSLAGALIDPTSAAPRAAQQDDAAAVEGVLAGFAHDLRNPMSTIKTYAGLQAASGGEESAELARLAVDACERVDEHLEFLQRFAELAPTGGGRVDLVEVLGEAVDAADAAGVLRIAARASLWARVSPDLARFVADTVVAECRARTAGAAGSGDEASAAAPLSAGHEAEEEGSACADIAADKSALVISIPVGAAAVDQLGKWLEGTSLPWRLALARSAARRGGGDLELETRDGEMRLRWRLPSAGEGSNDEQAGSPDRRRRSRSS